MKIKTQYFEGISMKKAIMRWKHLHNIVACRGAFEEGQLVIYGRNTLRETKRFLLVEVSNV